MELNNAPPKANAQNYPATTPLPMVAKRVGCTGLDGRTQSERVKITHSTPSEMKRGKNAAFAQWYSKN
jgi:hypothetical protein